MNFDLANRYLYNKRFQKLFIIFHSLRRQIKHGNVEILKNYIPIHRLGLWKSLYRTCSSEVLEKCATLSARILIGIKDYTKKTRTHFNRLFCKSYQYKLFVPHVYIRLLNQYSNIVWYNTTKNIHTNSRPQIYTYIDIKANVNNGYTFGYR